MIRGSIRPPAGDARETSRFVDRFEEIAQALDPTLLRHILLTGSAEYASVAHRLFGLYAESCIRAGTRRAAIASLRTACVIEPAYRDALDRLLAMAATQGRSVPDRWSRVGAVLMGAGAAVLSEREAAGGEGGAGTVARTSEFLAIATGGNLDISAPNLLLRLRMVIDPADVPDVVRDNAIRAVRIAPGDVGFVYRLCLWSVCLGSDRARYSRMAGRLVLGAIEMGFAETLETLGSGRLLHFALYREALLEAKIKSALARLERVRFESADSAVTSVRARLGDRIRSAAHESGMTPDEAIETIDTVIIAQTARDRPEPEVVERSGRLEVWKVDPASYAPPRDPPYNRLGSLAGRLVGDARITPRPAVRTRRLSGSLNRVEILRLNDAVISEGMLVATHRSGLVLGPFAQVDVDRLLTADSLLRQQIPGLCGLFDGGAVLAAATAVTPVSGIAIPGYSLRNSDTFGHFVLDSLGRTLAASADLDRGDVTIVLPDNTPEFVERIYRWFGFVRLVSLPKGGRAVCDTVSVASVSVEPLSNFAQFDVLRSATLSRLPTGGGPSRIYLSRSRLVDADRSVSNEAEVEAALDDLGFVTVHPQELTFETQLALYAGADVIVSAYGSAIHVAAVFARPSTLFVEIITRRPARELVTFYQQLGHTYRPVVSAARGGSDDYAVPLEPLARAVQRQS